jgi:hypothetical protein
MNQNGKILLDLTPDEALVFFDWLARFNAVKGTTFQDQAEQRVLWNLEAELETVLAAPFAPNYEALLSAARDRVRDRE